MSEKCTSEYDILGKIMKKEYLKKAKYGCSIIY